MKDILLSLLQVLVMIALVVIALFVGFSINHANAQSLSAKGTLAGNDTIVAVVPVVGNLMDTYDRTLSLIQASVNCGQQGLFVSDADNADSGCRGPNAPTISFVPESSGSSYAQHVRVQWDGEDASRQLFSVESSVEAQFIQHPPSGSFAGSAGGYSIVE